MLKQLENIEGYRILPKKLGATIIKETEKYSSSYEILNINSFIPNYIKRNLLNTNNYKNGVLIIILIEFNLFPVLKKESLRSKEGKSTDKYFQDFLEKLVNACNKNQIKIHESYYSDIFRAYKVIFSINNEKTFIEYDLLAVPNDRRTGAKGFTCTFEKRIHIKKFF